jgi:exopolysaccharide production protein ExoQ
MVANSNPAAAQTLGAVYLPFKGGKLWEQGMLIIWFVITFLPMESAAVSALRYLFVLYFLSFLVLDSRNTVANIARSFWLLPLQVLAVLSVFWAPFPDAALRTALLYLTSTLIIIILAARYTPRQILRCMMITAMITSLFVLITPNPMDMGGPYASKNNLATHMLMGFILCFSFALDNQEHPLIRMAALFFALVMAFITVMANSTTALLFLICSSMIILFARVVFLDLSRIQNIRTVLFLLGVGFSLALVYGALVFVDQAVLDEFLGVFGKDTSLTGRTALWAAAGEQIEQNRYLGLGMEGFWYYDSGVAQTLNENDHKPFGTQLTFHNAYLEVGVHLGYIGLVFFITSLIWVVWQMLAKIVKKPDMVVAAFAVIVLVSMINTFTESVLWGPFDAQGTLFYVAGAAFAGRDRRRLIGRLVVRTQPTAPA